MNQSNLNSRHQNVNRSSTQSSYSLRRTNVTTISESTSTTASNLLANRPMTRSLAKMQQQQQQQQQQQLLRQADQNEHQSTSNSLSTVSNSVSSLTSNHELTHLKLTDLSRNFKQPVQQAYQKIIVNEKPCNLLMLVENSRLTGRMPRNLFNLPDKTLQSISPNLHTHDYPILMKRLDQSSITINLENDSKEVNDLLKILKDLENRLMSYSPNTTEMDNSTTRNREEFEVETINIESARVFRNYGGVEIFKRILLMNLMVDNKTISNYKNLSDSKLNQMGGNHSKSFFHNFQLNSNSLATDIDNSSKMNSSDDDDDYDDYYLKEYANSSFLNNSSGQKLKHSPSSNNYSQFLFNNNNNNNNNSLNKKSGNMFDNFEKYCILRIKCKCIQILNRLICLPGFGKLLVNDLLNVKSNNSNNVSKPSDGSSTTTITLDSQKIINSNQDTTLLQYLFSLLMFKESRLQACQLIESILLHMPMLNLNKINNIKFILESIDDDGLSCICKIFAVTLSNLDMNEKKYLANTQKRIQQQLQLQKQAMAAGASSSSSSAPTTSANANTDESSKQPTVQQPLSIRDQNQDLLLNIPTLLFRLVNLVRRKDYAVRYGGANSEIEHWIRYIDQTLSDSDDNDIEIGGEGSSFRNFEFLNNRFSNNSNTNNTNRIGAGFDNQLYQPALLAASKLNNFVYVLYTLSLLLIGKEKKKVQKLLTRLRLASALNSLFDYLIWNCRCEYPNAAGTQVAAAAPSNNANNNQSQQQQQQQQAPPPQQPPVQQQQQQMRSHICPEVAVKIQFLRLVHSFCDHSEYKRIVLSRQETEEIIGYNQEANPCLQVNDMSLKVENRFRCTKDEIGLLSKIVRVIKQEPFSASFRFWLIRAIESFLRGATSYADQLFLINRGVVQDTVQNILAINFTRPKEVLQSCFDMLGELIKFNINGFQILNNELVEIDKFNMILTMINQSLIDSNMFLRSIFLSIDFFENNADNLNFNIAENKILKYFDLFERRISFLCRMMNIINIQNLSQENVSCLNTTLILLMLANKKNTLPKYLRAIKSKSLEMLLANDLIHVNSNGIFYRNTNASTSGASSTTISSQSSSASSQQSTNQQQPLDLITNFRDLLIFWQSHYLQKDKDCAGLEQNSRIDFSYWKKTVELLLDKNVKNECSLTFYLENDLSYLANSKNRIDENRSD